MAEFHSLITLAGDKLLLPGKNTKKIRVFPLISLAAKKNVDADLLLSTIFHMISIILG